MSDPSASEDAKPSAHPALVAAAVVLCLAPAIAYASLLQEVSANVPYLDDYDVILAFLNQWTDADSFGSRASLVFAQHAEHRMAFLRGLSLLSLGLRDGIDFDTLNKLGSLGLFILVALLFVAGGRDRRISERTVAFVPVPLLLLHPQFWDCLLWPTSSLANFWVVSFALASVLLVVRRDPLALAGAALFAWLATFSQGNGMLVWPLAAGALFAARRSRDLGLWCAIAAVTLAFYFNGYERPGGEGPLWGAAFNGFEPLAYALNLIGSGPAFTRPGLSLIVGGLGLASFVALVWQGLPRRNPPLFLLLLFVLGSVAANALGRTGLGGPHYALQSPRYQFFSAVFWATTALAASELLGSDRRAAITRASLSLVAIAFCVTSFAVYRPDVERVSQRLQRGMLAWATHGSGLVYPDEARASEILTRAIETGLYVVPVDELMLSTPIEQARSDPAGRTGR